MDTDETTITAKQWRERYAQGPDALDTALAGLSERDFDTAISPAEWTIREIIHHIAEVEIRATFWMTVAVGNSGATCDFDWFPGTNKVWGAALRFDTRPVAPSLAMIRQVRAYLLALLAAAPSAGSRYVLLAGGEIGETPIQLSVDDAIRAYSQHLDEHLATIHAIRTHNAP